MAVLGVHSCPKQITCDMIWRLLGGYRTTPVNAYVQTQYALNDADCFLS
jgi:hypothetical protein